jgi:hypothetical protein
MNKLFADVPSAGEDKSQDKEAGAVCSHAQHSSRVWFSWIIIMLHIFLTYLNLTVIFYTISWMSLGNQLEGVRLVDEGLRARFKAAYPDVVVQPSSPPRASAMEIDSTASQMRSPFSVTESKSMATQFADRAAPETVYTSEEKPMALDAVMAG